MLGSSRRGSQQLLKDPVGLEQQRLGNGQAENPCCLQVDRQLELRRLLDWQLARLCTLEDAIDVQRGPPEQLGRIGKVRNEAAGFDIQSLPDHDRKAVLYRQLNRPWLERVSLTRQPKSRGGAPRADLLKRIGQVGRRRDWEESHLDAE